MKNLPLILCTLLTQALFSQETIIPTEPTTRPFYFGVGISPLYTYRTLEIETHSDADFIVGLRNDDEEPRISYAGSLRCGYALSERFCIESGVEYMNLGYRTVMDNLVYGDMVDPRKGFLYETSEMAIPEEIHIIDSFHYLCLPIAARISMGNRRCQFTSSAGLRVGWMFKSNYTVAKYFPDAKTQRDTYAATTDYEKFNLFPTVSAGATFRLNDHLKLSAEPTFTYGLLKMYDSNFKENLWSAGLNFSLNYYLR